MGTRSRNILVVLGVCLALAPNAPPGHAAPRVIAVGLDPPAVVGAETGLRVRAVDPQAPVSGMTVAFGSQVFALSACRPADSQGRLPGGAFAPGTPVTLRAPHTFSRLGAQGVVARVDSGGCGTRGGTVYQPLTITPSRPGQLPVAPVIGIPVTLPSLLPAGPGLPGGVELPGLPGLGAASGLDESVAIAAARCPTAHRRVRRSRRAVREARQGSVCVINAVRRRAGLRALRENRRLVRAATAHSRSMVKRRYFSHVAPGGVVLNARLRRVGYLPARRWRIGENLASAGRSATPVSMIRAWLRSPPHRTVLLEGSFREVGLGIVLGRPSGGRGATYTADFGVRR